MTELWNIIVGLLIIIGAFFTLFAALGVLRFPDLYTRMHAASKAGVFGSGLILIGLAIHASDVAISLRAVLAILFLILTTPISAHLLAKAAYAVGYPAWKGTAHDEMRTALNANKPRARKK
jgi:multicomponent Na+:H+ antiporter subunit G